MAEGGGLLNRYTMSSRIVSSNLIPSAIAPKERRRTGNESGLDLLSSNLSQRFIRIENSVFSYIWLN